MTKLSIAALLALVSSCAAGPVSKHGNTVRAASDSCSYTLFANNDAVEKLYTDIGPIDQLDLFLNSMWQHEKLWVDSLWTMIFPDDGASPLTGCGTVGSTCDLGSKGCKDFNATGLGAQYWTFEAVVRLHSKLNGIYTQLTMDGWAASLKIPSIASDFGLPEPDDDWPEYISQAFTLATLGLDDVPEIAGTFVDFTVDALKEASPATNEDATDPTKAVQDALSDIVKAAGDNISWILATVTGASGDPTTLPIYTDSTLQYAISRFFNDPSILVDLDAENQTFTKTWDNFNANVEKKIVDLTLGAAYYVLAGDAATAQSACTQTGDRWLSPSGTGHCFHFISQGSSASTCKNNDVTTCDGQGWNVVDDTFYDNLERYGFDIDTYYGDLIACHLDSTNCFFNVPVKKAVVKTVTGSSGETTMTLGNDLS